MNVEAKKLSQAEIEQMIIEACFRNLKNATVEEIKDLAADLRFKIYKLQSEINPYG